MITLRTALRDAADAAHRASQRHYETAGHYVRQRPGYDLLPYARDEAALAYADQLECNALHREYQAVPQ